MKKYIVFCNAETAKLGNVYVVSARNSTHAKRLVEKDETNRFYLSAMKLSLLIKCKQKWSYF